MVRCRWTPTLILICLPILVTVITAFRVRDLPKFEDSVKLDRNQKCDDCDVKFGQKLHSIKTESDKYKNENFKKVVKQHEIDQKSGSKFDTSNENDDDLSILKGKLELKKDYPSASKINLDTSSKKLPSFSQKDVVDSDVGQKSSSPKKTKIPDIKSSDTKSSTVKDTISKTVKHDGNRRKEDDDFKDDRKTVPLKPKLLSIKNVESKRTDPNDEPTKFKDKDSSDNEDFDHNKKNVGAKLKLLDTKKIEHKSKEESFEVSDSRSISEEIEEDDEDDDEDDDDDDENDDDDDGALSSLWETFSLWGLNIDPSLKPAEKKEKQLIPKIKTTKRKNDTKDTLTVPIENLLKVKETTIKLEIKPVISSLKETVQRPLLKTVTPKKVLVPKNANDENDNIDNDDDDADKEDNKDISQLKYMPKSRIKETDESVTTKKKITRVEVKTVEDHDDGDADFKLFEEKYKLKSSQNIKKVEKPKKIVKIIQDNDDSDDNDEEDDDENDDKESNNIIKNLSSKSKTTSNKDDKKNIITKKAFKIENVSDGDEDDDEDDDINGNDSDKLLNKMSVEGKKSPEKKPLSENKKENKKQINKQVVKDDKKIKKEEEIVKSEPRRKDSSHSNKEQDVKIAKLEAKNETTTNQLPKNGEIKEKKASKSLDDKYKKETDKIDQGKDLKFKDKIAKAPQRSQPDTVGQKPLKTGNEKDSVDGLNINDIKKEIKAQIRSNQEDKKSNKSKEKLRESVEITSSTDSNLKHVTDALHRRNLLKSDFEDFYAFFPTFAPNFSRIHNPECRRHGQIVLRQLRGTKLWALNMLDATAKIPSGILQGNGIQLGDFDQCVGSRARVQLESGSVVKVQGKYCLARLDVKAEHPELDTPVHLAQARNLMRSRIDDPGHFVPRFSTLSWGVCVPAVCNPEDVEVIIKDAIKHYQKTSGVVVRVKVDKQDCYVEEAEWWKNWTELPVILTLSFYGVVVLLVLVATLQDFFARRNEGESEKVDEKTESNKEERKYKEKDVTSSKKSDNFVSSFSLYYTLNKLLAPGTTDDIACIHGVRAIATIALLIAHKFLPVAVMPYTNRLKITELASSPLWSWCRAGWMFTDCFLLLSGALTAHKASDNNSGAPRRLFSRYMRLTPALLALVLFYAYIWDNVSSGPMWGTFVTKNAEVCQEGWWWNLLYMQNYFGFEEMCAPQTHQLALDMQLTILGGILIWVMQVKHGVYKIVMPVLHIIAAYSRYTTVKDHRLTMLAYHGVSVSQLYRTARLSYTSVLHRSTPYLVGLSLGLALKTPAEPGTFLLGIGWISSTALWCLVWWVGADSGSMQYRYNSTFAAQYASLAPIASALAIAWFVYAVHSGGSGFLSRFLCCRPLVFISRLSYAIYLTQFIVYITNVATVKTSREFTLMSLIDVQEILAILLSAVILTVTFVIPMQSLHKIFVFPAKSENSKKPIESSENQFKEEKKEEKQKEQKNIETPQLKSRPHLIAHREMLEEIPETEVEYESQRDNEGLGEIVEEEDDDIGEESIGNVDIEDDLEIIEEEQGGEDEEDESWLDRRQYEYTPRRSDSNENEEDIDEWEWTANGSRNGAQYYRYSR